MNLLVKSAYSGVLTKGRIIAPGIYASDDPQVVDAAEAMIRKGFAEPTALPVPAPTAQGVAPVVSFPVDDDDVIGAEVREEAIPVALVEDEAAESAVVDYESCTAAELRELAEAAGLEVVGTGSKGAILKADYIRALLGAEA